MAGRPPRARPLPVASSSRAPADGRWRSATRRVDADMREGPAGPAQVLVQGTAAGDPLGRDAAAEGEEADGTGRVAQPPPPAVDPHPRRGLVRLERAVELPLPFGELPG